MAVKDTVITALRLSPAAATGLSDEIDRNIRTARAELNRSGVPLDVASSDHDLVVEAIATYCCMKMGAPDRYEQYRDAWIYQEQNLRKSTIEARTRDKDGYYSGSTTSDLAVYCKIKSATRSEVYEALRSGVSVKIMALVYADDYRAACVTVSGKKTKPSTLLFDGTEYSIVRVYQKDDVIMELSLSEVE